MRAVGVSDQNVLRCSVARTFFEVKQPATKSTSGRAFPRPDETVDQAGSVTRVCILPLPAGMQERQGGYSGVASTSCQKG